MGLKGKLMSDRGKKVHAQDRSGYMLGKKSPSGAGVLLNHIRQFTHGSWEQQKATEMLQAGERHLQSFQLGSSPGNSVRDCGLF